MLCGIVARRLELCVEDCGTGPAAVEALCSKVKTRGLLSSGGTEDSGGVAVMVMALGKHISLLAAGDMGWADKGVSR